MCDGTSHDFIKPGNTFEILRIGFEEEEAKSVKTNEIDNEYEKSLGKVLRHISESKEYTVVKLQNGGNTGKLFQFRENVRETKEDEQNDLAFIFFMYTISCFIIESTKAVQEQQLNFRNRLQL